VFYGFTVLNGLTVPERINCAERINCSNDDYENKNFLCAGTHPIIAE